MIELPNAKPSTCGRRRNGRPHTIAPKVVRHRSPNVYPFTLLHVLSIIHQRIVRYSDYNPFVSIASCCYIIATRALLSPA